MKKIISLILVSLALIGGYAYADSLNDLQINVHNGTSFVPFNMTPSADVDTVLVYDKDSEVYRLAELDPALSVGGGLLNFNTTNLATSLYTPLQAYFSLLGHTHPISDIVNLQVALDSKVSSSVIDDATSSLQTQINSINTTLSGVSTTSPVITNGVSRTIATTTTATGTRLSTTKTSNVMYSVNIVTTASIGGASAGEVFLEISPNNTATSTWTVINRLKNSQTITLALALNSVQDLTYNIMGNIPAGYYMRLRSNNISGTPTYTFVTGQEMQF